MIKKNAHYNQDLSAAAQLVSNEYQSRARAASKTLKDRYKNGERPMLEACSHDAYLPELENIANRIREQFKAMLVLGMGGSTLNPQAITAIKSAQAFPVLYWDDINIESLEAHLANYEPHDIAVLISSKSGRTMETLAQFLAVHERFKHAVENPAQQYFFISDPGENPIRQIAEKLNAPCLDHPKTIGGRFATFTIISILPALVAGLDVRKFLKAAEKMRDEWLTAENSAPTNAAAIAFSAMKSGFSMTVMMPYIQALSPFTQWYCQIWSESLGKNGKGTTPIRALGPLDQHSQLQLYLDGPKDKLFTLIVQNMKKNTACKLATLGIPAKEIAMLEGKTLSALLHAEQAATIETFRRRNCPLRVIEINAVDEETLGALSMHMILETLIMAELLEVDPIDQPAVEEGKRIAAEWLSTHSV